MTPCCEVKFLGLGHFFLQSFLFVVRMATGVLLFCLNITVLCVLDLSLSCFGPIVL